MKKTLATLVMMVVGLAMTASALLPVTADECTGVGDMDGEFSTMLMLLGGQIGGVPTTIDTEAELGVGLPDMAKAELLAAAMCVESDLATAFGVNKLEAFAFADAILGLVEWAGASVDEVNAAATALDTFVADPVYVATLQAVLTGALGADAAQGIIFMLTDEAMCDLLELSYIPDQLDTLAITLTGMGTEIPQNPYYALPGAIMVMFPNAFTAWLSCSSVGQATIVALFENELLDNARAYAGLLADVKQIFDALALTASTYLDPPEMVLAADFLAFSQALQDGIDAIDAIQVPTPAILGVDEKVDNGEPFSAGGDYDGDGVLNLTTWNAVKDSGGINAFIAAASGADPYYEGNPLLPAAGLIGLAALVSAIAGGGAFVLRKK